MMMMMMMMMMMSIFKNFFHTTCESKTMISESTTHCTIHPRVLAAVDIKILSAGESPL